MKVALSVFLTLFLFLLFAKEYGLICVLFLFGLMIISLGILAYVYALI